MKSAYDNESARCKAYAGQFNIDLFNSAVQLAISTTEAPKQVKEVQQKLNQLPWYERKDATAFFEPHGIRYFGELLERYGAKRRHRFLRAPRDPVFRRAAGTLRGKAGG